MKFTYTQHTENGEKIYKLYIDTEYCFSVTDEEFFKFHLYEKVNLAEKELYDIKFGIDFDKAKIKALGFLSYGLRPKIEIKRKLADIGFGDDIIEKTVDYFEEKGYFNDTLYTQRFIKKAISSGKSKNLARLELENKGIDRELIEEEIEKSDTSDIDTAKKLIERRFINKLNDKNIYNKIYSYLRYRGFDSETISETIKIFVNDK